MICVTENISTQGKCEMKNDIISILSPSLNHEKYMKFFIDSVLAQTNPNWELIIVDDGSTDNNIAEIKKYEDPRIKLIQQPFNMGLNCALMTAFENSCGKYVAFCATDDALMPNFVQSVTDFMDSNPDVGVLYTGLQCMDTENNIIPDRTIVADTGNRYEILKKLFYSENIMTSPGQVVRSSEFARIQPLNVAMSQNQDCKIHVDLLLHTNCHTLPDKLIMYRVPSVKSGLSYRTPLSKRRCELEERRVMDAYLQISDVDTLKNIFQDDLKPFGKIDKKLIPYVLGMLAMNSKNEYKKIWGHTQVSDFIDTIDNYQLVNKKYGFCYRDFLNLAGKFDTNPFEIKYLKYKNLFNKSLILALLLGLLAIL